MDITELYAVLLNLASPWDVVDVLVDEAEKRVDVHAEHEPGTRFPCPQCGALLPVYDHTPGRAWRHLDSCHFSTFLHACIPRVACHHHGVKQVLLPWALPSSHFTIPFEQFAMTVLHETDVQGAAELLRISWDQTWGIMERAVARGQKRKRRRIMRLLGVDEKSVGAGQDYFTLVTDLTRSTVEYIADDRTKDSLAGFYEGLNTRQLAGIEAIAMDMWKPFIRATREQVPDADEKIVFDRFHIMKHMNEAVDAVRKKEHRQLRQEGDDTLSGTKYLWLFAEENLPEKHEERFTLLKGLHLKTARAWALKEMLRDLWRYKRRGWAAKHFRGWHQWATRSRLEPVRKVATMLRAHLRNVLTYFDHRITTATCEGVNNKIQAIKHNAFGFRNRDHFRTAIFFHCGGLDLRPVLPKKAG
jgi:transposase